MTLSIAAMLWFQAASEALEIKQSLQVFLRNRIADVP